MAGIGFTLRKVIARRQLGSSLQAAVSGIFVVAGPWILSIVTLSVVNRYLALTMGGGTGVFLAQLIYSYASSLIIFSPIHLLFTRLVADLIWEKRESEASGLLLWFALATALLALLISLPVVSSIPYTGVMHPVLFRASAILFYVSINLIWLILLFTSLLRWYGRILALMAAGMALAVAAIWVLGKRYGLSGAMAGFAIGHLLIALFLLILGLVSYPPTNEGRGGKLILPYVRRYASLILAGTLLNIGIWSDKIIYWFTRGSLVSGTPFRIFPVYDITVYYANLIMIPGLVYFVIFGETGFYTHLRKFLITLTRGSYAQLQKSKFDMLSGMNRELGNQQVFQGGISLVALLLAPSIFGRSVEVPFLLFQIQSAAVFFQLLLMTLINYLYYFELYRIARNAGLLYLLTVVFLTIAGELFAPGLPPGISTTAAALTASAFAYRRLSSQARKMDRIILTRE